MKVRPIRKSDYILLLELDKRVYPTDIPVTPAILDKWYMRSPEFGLVYESEGIVTGMCIAIPLNDKGWSKLVKGQLAESELDDSFVFDSKRDSKMGIHVYHIEKLDKGVPRFHIRALSDLSKLVADLKAVNPKLKVVGFSGLCTTTISVNIFFNKLNCTESYNCQEHILKNDEKLIIVNSDDPKIIDRKLKESYSYVTRCKMLAVTPDKFSVVWDYFS